MKWHTKEEMRIIKQHGGKHLKKHGYDGTIRNKPVEVRSQRKDNRYRIQKDVHNNLIRKKGSYIFVRNGRSKIVSAKRVSEMLSEGKWYKDRKYPHKFVKSKQVW